MPDYPLTYADVIVVAIVATITAIAVRRGYNSTIEKLKFAISKVLHGDSDARTGVKHNGALGELAEEIDLLLARRSSELSEILGKDEELSEREERIEKILDSGLDIVSKKDIDEIAKATIRHAIKITGASNNKAFLYLKKEKLYYSADELGNVDKIESSDPPKFLSWSIDNQKADYINNASLDDRTDEAWGSDSDKKIACLAAPLKNFGGAIMLTAENFDPRDVDSIETLLRFTSVAISSV